MNIPININKEEGFIPADMETFVKEEAGEKDKTPSSDRVSAAFYFDRILRIAIFATAFLVPLFYFFSSDTIDLSKSLLLSSLSLIILACWIGKIIIQGEFTWRSTWLFWPVLAIGVFAVLSNIFSVAPWVSFLGDLGRHSFSTISILSYLIFFLAATQNLRRRDALWLVVVMVVSGALAAIVSFFQFLGVFILPGEYTNARLFTPVGSVFSLALFIVVTLPILVELFYKVPQQWVKITWGILGLFALFVATLVNFDAVWIALLISFLFLIIMNFRHEPADGSAPRKLLLPLAVLIIAALFWLLPTIPGPRLVNIPAEISPSYQAGLSIVKETWLDSFKNSILGSGPETFPYVYAQHKSAALNQTDFWGVNFNNANAEILTYMTNHGLLGTLAWLVFVVGFIVLAFKSFRGECPSSLQIGLFASWLFILASKFLYPTPIALEIFFWLLPAVFIVTQGKTDYPARRFVYTLRGDSRIGVAIFLTLVVLLVVSVGGLYLSIQRWMSESSYAKIFLIENTAENRDQLIINVANAIALNSYEARYYRAFSQLTLLKTGDVLNNINSREASARQATPEETNQIQNLTVNTFNALAQARNLDPENISLLIDAAESYKAMNAYVSGANEVAISVYEQAVELDPVNPFLRTQLAQLYLIQDNFFLNPRLKESDGVTKAKQQFEKAIDLNPRYSNARYFMGFILDREGDRQGALDNFWIVATLNPDNQIIAQIVVNLQSGLSALGSPPLEEPEIPPVETKEAQGVPGE